MFERQRNNKRTRFCLAPASSAREVQLVGDFTHWKPVPMKKQKDGMFSLDMSMPAGTYEYKFLVDGKWVPDPDNSVSAINPFGSINSVARLDQ